MSHVKLCFIQQKGSFSMSSRKINFRTFPKLYFLPWRQHSGSHFLNISYLVHKLILEIAFTPFWSHITILLLFLYFNVKKDTSIEKWASCWYSATSEQPCLTPSDWASCLVGLIHSGFFKDPPIYNSF